MFYAVVAIDHRPGFVSLTSAFSCIQLASDGRDRTSLYLAFTSASVLQAHSIQDAEQFPCCANPSPCALIYGSLQVTQIPTLT
jgi:hypothetical protein